MSLFKRFKKKPVDTEAPPAPTEASQQGLEKSSNKISSGLLGIFNKKRLDDEMLEALEDLLISSDIGAKTAEKIIDAFAPQKFKVDATPEAIKETLAKAIIPILTPVAKPLTYKKNNPHVILVSGVNGAGKTTTIGKMASQFSGQGYKTALVAADTFRAAAVEQLQVWGERAGVPVYTTEQGRDGAALVFDAMQDAKQKDIDILFIDTSGRLHNKNELMQELGRMIKVIQKCDASAPHDSLLVLDATNGQTALRQVEIFQNTAHVSGLIVTKLDGTARGGVVVALADQFKLPIHAIGVGEKIDDLQAFDAESFANGLVGLYSDSKIKP